MEGTDWTRGAARAVRAAAKVLQEEAPDLRLTVDQINDVLVEYTEANPDELGALRHEIDGLKEAMLSRATIEQAKGVLMGAQHCTPDEAFDMLRRASQRENTKLRDFALRIVETARRPDQG